MTTKMHVSCSFDTTDDHRDHARITMGLAPELEALEEKIQALTGTKTRVECRPKRANAAKNTSSETEQR